MSDLYFTTLFLYEKAVVISGGTNRQAQAELDHFMRTIMIPMRQSGEAVSSESELDLTFKQVEAELKTKQESKERQDRYAAECHSLGFANFFNISIDKYLDRLAPVLKQDFHVELSNVIEHLFNQETIKNICYCNTTPGQKQALNEFFSDFVKESPTKSARGPAEHG